VFIILPKENKEEDLISLSPIFDYLEKRKYSWSGEHIIIKGIPVQFIPADALEKEAIKEAREIEYEREKTKIITPEYLIAILLRVGRKKDVEKIERLLELKEINKKKLEDILLRFNLTKRFEELTR
jgi:hypothetical protein